MCLEVWSQSWFANLLLNSRAASMVQPAANVLSVSVSCLRYNYFVNLWHWPPSKFMKVILYVRVRSEHGDSCWQGGKARYTTSAENVEQMA